MSKKKEYKIIITVNDENVKREVIGDNIKSTEIIGMLEILKAEFIKELLSE
jgi:hypothetical protein